MPLFIQKLKTAFSYAREFAVWLIIAVITGIIAGLVGSAFHMAVDFVTLVRKANEWLIYLLPVAGIFIVFVYSVFKKYAPLDTNRILNSVNDDTNVPLIILPLIFVCASFSHLVGASVGREGAALQLGGSTGSAVGSLFRLKRGKKRIAVMSGMSAAFSALFGTPVTSAIFALEVANVGSVRYNAFFPCIVSSCTAFCVSSFFGIEPTRFSLAIAQPDGVVMIKTVLLSVLCALVSIAFCAAIRNTGKITRKAIPNPYIRTLVCSLVLICLTRLCGTYDYNGAGMDIVGDAIAGNAHPEAFVLKLIFTAVSIAALFKGGEIVPAFFVGSAFGCVVSPLVGLEPSLGAAIGFVALFCGAVNCPLASLVLALEVFGTEHIAVFALVCAVSYLMSGNLGLYSSQKMLFSKTQYE